MIARTFLLDGPLMTTPERRAHVIKSMAEDIIQDGAIGDRQDAVRTLHDRGYSITDIHCLIDDARQVAFQTTVDVVAEEMSKP